MSAGLFTIGHSNHEQAHLIELLAQHEIEVLADVRSAPYSRYTAHFNREALQSAVKSAGMQYLFLGDSLGGRPPDSECYDEGGFVLYWRQAETPLFLSGIERIERGREKYRVAMMCSEEDPTVCHRYRLISRVLAERGVVVQHIRGDGQVQSQQRVDQLSGVGQQSLLFSELEQESWKSLRSVSPKAPPNTSLDGSGEPEYGD